MNLIIDIGNTTTKIDVFDGNSLIISEKTNIIDIHTLLDFFRKNTINNKIKVAIVSTVAHYPTDIIDYLKAKMPLIFFDEHTRIPIKNTYTSPKTLGKDRLASAVGANHLYPNQNVLCIDAGTCIKYDFVNSQNEYCGGSISPGYNMRFKALNTFTENLPLIHGQSINFITGKNTDESILSGVINGTSAEINGMIQKYQSLNPELKIILSGGEMKYFDNNLNFSIFAIPNLVSLGLNIILDYNKLTLS